MPLENDEILKNVTIVVRSLITSMKPPVSLQTIERDYLMVEQEPIPYRRFGFASSQELLEHTNAFCFNKVGNQTIVTAKPNPKSAHIASMVRMQKPSKTHAIVSQKAAAAVNTNKKGQQPFQPRKPHQQQHQHYQQGVRNGGQHNAYAKEQHLAHCEEQLFHLRNELVQELMRVHQQQTQQEWRENEALRYQENLCQEQRAEILYLQEQHQRINSHFEQLQAEHNRDLLAQARTISWLEKERFELQNKLKAQKLRNRQERERLSSEAQALKAETEALPKSKSEDQRKLPVQEKASGQDKQKQPLTQKAVGEALAKSKSEDQRKLTVQEKASGQDKQKQPLTQKAVGEALAKSKSVDQRKLPGQEKTSGQDKQKQPIAQKAEAEPLAKSKSEDLRKISVQEKASGQDKQKQPIAQKAEAEPLDKSKSEDLRKISVQEKAFGQDKQKQHLTQKAVGEALAKSKSEDLRKLPVQETASGQDKQKQSIDSGASTAKMNDKATAGAAAVRKAHLRPILGNSASQRPDTMRQPSTTATPAGFYPAAATAANKAPSQPRIQYPLTRPTGRVSVNYRLKQQQTAVLSESESDSTPSAVQPITAPDLSQNVASKNNSVPRCLTPQNQQTKEPQKLMQPSLIPGDFKIDQISDPITSLQKYCTAHGLEPPAYEFYNANKSKKLHCKVRVGENIFSSYPEEHIDELSARLRTAEIAVERLKFSEARKKLSTLSGNEFLDSLYQELIKHPHGILSCKLPEWYEATLNRQVPANWWNLINHSPKMCLENSLNSHIVFANTAIESATLVPSAGPKAIPELQLPWADGQLDWSMYITHCDNTTHVWARLIDSSAQFAKLTEQLNAHMSRVENRQPLQQQPMERQVYVVEVSTNWNRVRVMSVDADQRECSCHFLDFGDEVAFSFDVLYMCPQKFLTLPAQAVCLSMYALDKFEEHPHALPVLSKELAGHSVVARIITSEAQYLKSGGLAQGVIVPAEEHTEEKGSVTRRACIVGTFYDTSTAEDIHLNDLVANQIIRNTPAPSLKLEPKSNHVLVSHVNDVGDLMVLVPNADLKFVQNSVARIMSDSSEQHRVRYTDLLHDQLVCVCDATGDGPKQWYRGMLTAKPKSPEEEVFDVYYVDDGRLRKTHISNIYRLEANNLALASYPAQALRVRLHDVPPIDNQMVERLRCLLSPQTPVLLKVMEGANDKLPMVTIHARGQDSLYLCLNSAIRVEYEVQSTSRLEPFDDGGLHFSASGQLIRRSSFSSTVSSQSSCSDQPSAVSVASPPVTPNKGKSPHLAVLKEYEAIPAIGAYFEVRVTLSVNPGHFAVQPYKCYNQLQRLMKDLQEHCKSSSAQKVKPDQLTIGQPYAAADSDGVYHRVNIRKIYDEMIHVRYVDAGDDGVVRCSQLLQLTPEFRELPMMALPAQLHGILLTGIDWTQENCVRFRQLTLGRKFIGIVRRVDKLKDDRRALSLELIDTSTPHDIKVHETLISEKHAQPAT